MGYSAAHMLPTDRAAWSDAFGHFDAPREWFNRFVGHAVNIGKSDLANSGDTAATREVVWRVARGWAADSEGWAYATDFPSLDWSRKRSPLSCVRRRRWTCVLVAGGDDDSEDASDHERIDEGDSPGSAEHAVATQASSPSQRFQIPLVEEQTQTMQVSGAGNQYQQPSPQEQYDTFIGTMNGGAIGNTPRWQGGAGTCAVSSAADSVML